ncbi:MAG: nuclear transport factor 2 family protein [Ilumatobacteraceae bacterium]|nr:nuclear transport factor 2 family protein [Ilumatobacteraceae bacterium]
MSEPDRPAIAHLDVVREAFAGVGAADAARQLTQYTDDMVLDLPFTDPPMRLVGKPRALSMLESAFEEYKMELTITEVHECADPDELIVEFVSNGHLTSTGKTYANTYIAVFRFRDGRICYQREFFNPLVAARALAP